MVGRQATKKVARHVIEWLLDWECVYFLWNRAKTFFANIICLTGHFWKGAKLRSVELSLPSFCGGGINSFYLVTFFFVLKMHFPLTALFQKTQRPTDKVEQVGRVGSLRTHVPSARNQFYTFSTFSGTFKEARRIAQTVPKAEEGGRDKFIEGRMMNGPWSQPDDWTGNIYASLSRDPIIQPNFRTATFR